MTETAPKDHVIRSITEDGAFRVITLRATDMARDAVRTHGLQGYEARVFSELLTGAILLRETMAPTLRVQVVLSGVNGVSFVADAHPDDGITRGLVSRRKEAGPIELGPGALLKVIRTLPRGDIHQSVVTADGEGVSGALMGYLQSSAQVTATIGVSTVMADERVVAAGGYIVQLLPEWQQSVLAIMTERLVDFAFLDPFLVRHDARAETLMAELLYGFPYEPLADSPLQFGCFCSEERALSALVTLGREEIVGVVAAREVLDLTCEYCGKVWNIPPVQLGGLLTAQ